MQCRQTSVGRWQTRRDVARWSRLMRTSQTLTDWQTRDRSLCAVCTDTRLLCCRTCLIDLLVGIGEPSAGSKQDCNKVCQLLQRNVSKIAVAPPLRLEELSAFLRPACWICGERIQERMEREKGRDGKREEDRNQRTVGQGGSTAWRGPAPRRAALWVVWPAVRVLMLVIGLLCTRQQVRRTGLTVVTLHSTGHVRQRVQWRVSV